MRLGLLWVGRTRDSGVRAAIERYVDRIARYVPVDVVEVKEDQAADRHAETGATRNEGRRLRERLPPGHEVVVLDVRGREMTSEEFAEFLQGRMNAASASRKGLTFVLGGHLGLDGETKRIADHAISLSRMTLPHELARLVAVEQIYRGLSIVHGARYHRT